MPQHPLPAIPDRHLTAAWEPALTELRSLPRRRLDRLVHRWLQALGLCPIRSVDPDGRAATYHALFGELPLTIPLRVRVHQRESRLQPHHVEAFAGHLVRAGVATGLLVTTGEFSSEAIRLAASYTTPRIALYSGPTWAAELARRRLGIRRRSLWQWVLDYARDLADYPPVSRSNGRAR